MLIICNVCLLLLMIMSEIPHKYFKDDYPTLVNVLESDKFMIYLNIGSMVWGLIYLLFGLFSDFFFVYVFYIFNSNSHISMLYAR